MTWQTQAAYRGLDIHLERDDRAEAAYFAADAAREEFRALAEKIVAEAYAVARRMKVQETGGPDALREYLNEAFIECFDLPAPDDAFEAARTGGFK